MRLEDAIWLAATIDAEGAIGLGKTTTKDRRADGSIRVSTRYGGMLMLTNTYQPMLDRAKALMASSEIIQKRGSRLGTKPVYQVFLRRREHLLTVLREIEPHLMEKRELARRLIGWLEWFAAERAQSPRMSPAEKRLARAEYDSRAEHVRAAMTTQRRAEA